MRQKLAHPALDHAPINCFAPLCEGYTNHHFTPASSTQPVVSRKADVIDTSVTATAQAPSLGAHKRSVFTHTTTIGLATHQLILEDTRNDDGYRISIGVDHQNQAIELTFSGQ